MEIVPLKFEAKAMQKNTLELIRTVTSKMFKQTLLILMLSAGHAYAANVPNFEKQISFNVREQNINVFLNALFQEIDVPVSINSALEGSVNGKFNDSARNVFDEISRAFDLTIYYDGTIVQAYKKNEITQNLLPASASQAREVVKLAKNLNLPDSNNSVTTDGNGVLVRGTERFNNQIAEMVASVKSRPVEKPQTVKIVEVEKQVSFPEDSPNVYQVFKLKHAWATDTNFPVGGGSIVVPGVATLLKELLQDLENPVYENTADTSGSLTGLRGQGLANKGVDSPQQKSEAKASSNARIVADSRLNAIIIRDKQEKMDSYRQLIESLDVESAMVEIEATIIDINTDKSRELGVNWRYQGDNFDVLLGQGNNSDQALVPGGLTPGQGQGGVLSLSLGEPAKFLSRIRALEQRGAAKVVSKPHVITLSDVEAVLAATTEFFVRVAGDEEVDLFNVPVGTTLRVTPHIFKDNIGNNNIKLLVNIEDGTQASGTVDNIPVVERSTISTQAVVREGDSLLVGGLVRETYRNAREQVPVLGSVPLLGGLFRTETKQVSRVERLFMITPRLAGGNGFSGGSNLPALAGKEKTLISESATRLSTDDIPYRRTPPQYWSNQSRAETNANAQLQQRADQTNAPVAPDTTIKTAVTLKPVFAVIENNNFYSPYTVQNLSNGEL